jgi:acetyl-CoA acetyltransferase
MTRLRARRAARPVPQAIHMGITAENVAARYRHHAARCAGRRCRWPATSRAAAAIAEGRFKEPDRAGGIKPREGHDHLRHRRAREVGIRDHGAVGWPRCAPLFKKDGSVTAGNASGINDGAWCRGAGQRGRRRPGAERAQADRAPGRLRPRRRRAQASWASARYRRRKPGAGKRAGLEVSATSTSSSRTKPLPRRPARW